MKQIKFILITIVIVITTVVSYSFVGNDFEISKNLDIFVTLLRELDVYYVDETNPGTLIKKGIDGMLESLDPYTNYIPESQMEDYRFMTTGQYGGIGALIRQKGEYIIIAEPYEGFPAQKAGLMAGDKILEIDGIKAKGKSTSEMSKILKGQPNTAIKLLIEREGTKYPIEKTINREDINISDVPYYGIIDNNIGYIKLTGFTDKASREFISAFKDLKDNKGMKSLMIDLRDNGGGLLNQSVNIVNVFVEKGTEVVSTKGKVKDWQQSHKALNTPIDTEIPIVILTNNGSASASEIVSGSIQDLDRGVVIGQKTFGKGLVQQTRSLSYNSKLKLTVAKYYIPSGRCIQKLDYSNKNEDGEAIVIPDSLRSAFKTKNGRIVFDGQGIEPDIHVERRKFSKLTESLVTKMLIFDFVTKYKLTHESITSAKEFKLSDIEYEEFVAFLSGKEYDYTTKSEQLLEELKKTAENEQYFNAVEKEYCDLKDKMFHDKKADLYKFKEEIKEMLENEIISRYYFQKGRIEASFSNDHDVAKAKEILSENSIYTSILNGTFKEEDSAKKTDD